MTSQEYTVTTSISGREFDWKCLFTECPVTHIVNFSDAFFNFVTTLAHREAYGASFSEEQEKYRKSYRESFLHLNKQCEEQWVKKMRYTLAFDGFLRNMAAVLEVQVRFIPLMCS